MGVRHRVAEIARPRVKNRSMARVTQEPESHHLSGGRRYDWPALAIEAKELHGLSPLLVEPGLLATGGEVDADQPIGAGHSLMDGRIGGIVVGAPGGPCNDPVSILLAFA